MTEKKVKVRNRVGLNGKSAKMFVKRANTYEASIWVEMQEKRIEAKGLLGVLSLGAVGGTTIKIIARGRDEKEAIDGLSRLVESGFEE